MEAISIFRMLFEFIIAPSFICIVSLYLGRKWESRPQLISFYGHTSEFNVKAVPPNQTDSIVRTHAVVIKNLGRKPANNVRIGHGYLPPNVKIHPPTNYTTGTVTGTGDEIIVPILRAGEEIVINYLYFPQHTFRDINTYVKSDEGIAETFPVRIDRAHPQWVLSLLGIFIIIGIFATIAAFLAFGLGFCAIGEYIYKTCPAAFYH